MGSLPSARRSWLLAAFALALSGCGPRPDAVQDPAGPADVASDQPADDVPPATAPPEAFDRATQARFDGYGDLRFGMDPARMRQAWGGELQRLPPDAEAEACQYLVPSWSETPSDFALMVEGGRFVRYDVGTARETAPGGGRVGMSADEIRTLYAGAVQEQPHKYVPEGHYLRIQDDGGPGVLVFETDPAGRVTSWRVGVPPQADYVEGCA